ncbi:MAG: 2OG-Fe(II) oxygenase [Bacteriovoracaceae bacterium]|nr:2OG-Fe(II) oxygenase [Bacteriovoracaceae bacterium]
MEQLIKNGFLIQTLALPSSLPPLIEKELWQDLDFELSSLIKPQGSIYQSLISYYPFENIEYITSIRDSKNEWEEDGIWHDDGSRMLAFSLSLNLNLNQIIGGEIGFRKKAEDQSAFISVRPYGDLIIFATGHWGWEHKVYKVSQGIRIVMAGWCS